MANPQDIINVGSSSITKTTPNMQDKIVAVDNATGKFINVTSGYYASKTETDTALGLKSDKATTYSKTEVEELVAPKANTTDVNAALLLKANLASPALTGTPSAPTASVGTNTTQLATTQFVKTEISTTIASLDALVFKGVIDTSTNPNYPAGDAGNLYRISVAGKIGGASGVNVEVGDLLLCLVDGSPAGNQASVGANWNISQVNIDGAVTSSETVTTDGDLIVFSGTSGKVVRKTTAAGFKTSLSLVKGDVGLGNVDNTSDLNKPISTATQTALNLKQDALGFTPENIANKTNLFGGASTTLYTSQKALSDGLLIKVDTNAISQVGWTTKLPTISINETTRVITLAVTNPNTSYDFYSQNKLISKTSSEQVAFSNTEGVHLIYYDANGNLNDATTNFDSILQNFATVTTFYWSVAQAKIIIGALNELHSSQIPPAIHYANHETLGTMFAGGLALSMNATGSGNVASDAQFSGASGFLNDDGLKLPISAKNLTDNFPLIYKTGASGNFVEVSPRTNFITTTGANGRAVYNQNNAGTWQLTELNNNDYNITYIYATTGLTTQYFGVISQQTYSTLNAAREGVKVPPDLGALPSAEYKLIGAILFQTASSYTNAVKTKIVPIDDAGTTYQDFRRITGVGAPASVSSGDLTAIYNSLNTKQDIDTLAADVSSKITNDATATRVKKMFVEDNITFDIQDSSIDTTQLANGGVTNAKIGVGAVDNGKVAENADIATSKLKQATITPSNTAMANNDTQDVINNKAQGQINQNITDIANLNTNKFDKTGGTVSGNMIVSGNLTVNGTTTLVNSDTIQVKDKNIELAYSATPTDAGADGGGITILGTTNKTLRWNAAINSFIANQNFNLELGKQFSIDNVNINQIAEPLKNKTLNGSFNTFANIPWGALASSFQNIYYVHGINGNDANNGFSPDTAFKTIAAANAAIGNAKAMVVILEGTSESITIAKTNVSYSSACPTQTGQIALTGTITIANTTSVVSFFGISFTNLNHTGAGSLYLENCLVSTSFTSTSSGFLRVVNTDLSSASVSITGSGYKNFMLQSAVGALTVNNASAVVTVDGSKCQNGVTLTAGLCNLNNVEGFINGTTNFFLTAISGSTIVLNNVKLSNINGTPAKIQVNSGANYWMNNVVYQNGNSVISGTNLNSFTTRFSSIYTDNATINSSNITNLSIPGATNDRALIYTGGIATTSQVTKANLETLLTGSTLNKLSTVSITNTDAYKIFSVDDNGNCKVQLPVLNLTTTERDALTNMPTGYIIYNSTDDKFQSYTGSAWANIVSAGTGNVSATGLTLTDGKAPVFNNDNGTSLALLDTTVPANVLKYVKSIKTIPIFTTTDRDLIDNNFANGDVIFNSTTNRVEVKLGSGLWSASNFEAFKTISTSGQTLLMSDDNIEVNAANSNNGSFVLTLPTIDGINGKRIFIRNISSSLNGAVTINAGSGQAITNLPSGMSSLVLPCVGAWVELISQGTSWRILRRKDGEILLQSITRTGATFIECQDFTSQFIRVNRITLGGQVVSGTGATQNSFRFLTNGATEDVTANYLGAGRLEGSFPAGVEFDTQTSVNKFANFANNSTDWVDFNIILKNAAFASSNGYDATHMFVDVMYSFGTSQANNKYKASFTAGYYLPNIVHRGFKYIVDTKTMNLVMDVYAVIN